MLARFDNGQKPSEAVRLFLHTITRKLWNEWLWWNFHGRYILANLKAYQVWAPPFRGKAPSGGTNFVSSHVCCVGDAVFSVPMSRTWSSDTEVTPRATQVYRLWTVRYSTSLYDFLLMVYNCLNTYSQSRLNVFWGPWARRADGAPPSPFPFIPSPLPFSPLPYPLLPSPQK